MAVLAIRRRAERLLVALVAFWQEPYHAMERMGRNWPKLANAKGAR